ncbi:MAG TPA: LPP20 family lipoprotein [Gammaproteobacteria bacterium]
MANLLACSGAASKPGSEPDWVAGNSAKYTSQRYLLGRGQADNTAMAEDRARADLAKIFMVNINVADIDRQKFTSTTGEQPASELTSEVSRTIVTSTSQILKGVQIAGIWTDEARKTVHALAVLPRQEASHGIRQEISRLDSLTRASIDAAASAKQPLDQVAYARRAVIAQQERLGHQKSLQIIDPSGRGDPAQYDIARLITDYEKLLPRVSIKPVMMGENLGIVASALPAALSSAGFTVTESDTADYVMEVSLKLAETFQKEGWFWGRGVLLMNLRDRQNTVLGQKEWPVKASAREESEVMLRVERAADDILHQNLLPAMVGFALAGNAAVK